MKKVLLILIAAVSLSATSCGYGGSVKTSEDSLAYALGVDVGISLMNNVDSTLNAELVCKGIMDVFAKNASMTETQTREFLQHYFTNVLPNKKATENEQSSNEMLSKASKQSGAKTTESGLIYVIETVGAEPKIAQGDTVTAHYILSDASGKVLQSSKDSGEPMTYTNIDGAMIAGFSEGVAMLGQGGVATLYLPFTIAYGEQGNGAIGPKQALKFEVEIVKVAKPTK